MNVKCKKKKNQVVNVNISEQQEIIAKFEAIMGNLKASTWHELENKCQFDKNEKLSVIVSPHLCLATT